MRRFALLIAACLLLTVSPTAAQTDPLPAECDTPDYGNLFILSDGRAADGAQTIITSSGCTAIITTSNITDPYTLTISPLAP